MNTFFAFSDECGSYSDQRSSNFKRKHPFYVRSVALVEAEEYKLFEKDISRLKQSMGYPANCEIKWAHIGDLRNGHAPEFLAGKSIDDLKEYIKRFLGRAAEMSSLRYIFTVTDNNTDIHTEYERLITWHIQNALQRVQMDLSRHENYGVIIIDDLHDKNKKINERCYQMMCTGDFVSYDNLKQSILVDYSHQCVGLQLADIVAGAFTNAMIREARGNGYQFAGELYAELITRNVRCAGTAGVWHVYNPYESQGYGLISIPRDNCPAIISAMNEILMKKEQDRLFGR